jgi:hypothetical protein
MGITRRSGGRTHLSERAAQIRMFGRPTLERVSPSKGLAHGSIFMLVLFAVLALPTTGLSQPTSSPDDDVGFTVKAVDALFGRSVGGTVVVTSGEGEERHYDLENGRALVTVSRSDRDYLVQFDGPGTARSQTLRPTERAIALRVVTLLDLSVLTLLHVAAVVAFLFARRSEGSEVESRQFGAPLPRPLRRRPAPEARVLVRVRLASGRVVEGWVDPMSQEANRDEILSLTPVRAFNESGKADVPNPLDSFIPRTTITFIETLDETSSDP